jgi:hypothetical protein
MSVYGGLLLACVNAIGAAAADEAMQPGLYEVTYTLELPNVVATGVRPATVHRCVREADVRDGTAFGVLSENPIRGCPLQDYALSASKASYRIVCAGPNAPSATGVFEMQRTAYRGLITMNMGGKNMTLSEHQRGKRLGPCP